MHLVLRRFLVEAHEGEYLLAAKVRIVYMRKREDDAHSGAISKLLLESGSVCAQGLVLAFEDMVLNSSVRMSVIGVTRNDAN